MLMINVDVSEDIATSIEICQIPAEPGAWGAMSSSVL